MSSLQPDRLMLLYLHLLFSVFALQRVLATDWQVLRGTLRAEELWATHRLLVKLLAALWLSGLALAAIDLGFNPLAIVDRPKLATKFVVVSVLTVNGAFLRWWCFPRLLAGKPMATSEELVVTYAGAVSTVSWMSAAFFGIARPLADWPLARVLSLYGLALGGAILVALVLVAARRHWQRPLRVAIHR